MAQDSITLVVENHNSSLYFAYLQSNIFTILSSVEEVPEGESYIYVLDIMDSNIQFYNKFFNLKKRVVADCKAKVAKILFYEPWEANDTTSNYQKTINKFAKNYKIPITEIGFCDSNFETQAWNRSCSIRRFSVMFFEEMLGMATSQRRIKKYKKRAGLLERKLIDCKYRYINLNRKIRPHRTDITQEIADNHDNVTLWSYVEEGKILDIQSDKNDLDITAPLIDEAYLNIVSESYFGDDKLFLTEKVFKPISIGQPFILVGCVGSLKKLRDLGYFTFSGLINEDYDTIEDEYLRMDAIKAELRRLTALPDDEFKDLMAKCYKISKKNINVLYLRYAKHEAYKSLANDLRNWIS